jgi:gamma-glutamyltranspeptidase
MRKSLRPHGEGALMHAFLLAAVLSVVTAPHAMVVTEQRLASQAGLEVLERGGNAVDAAVAVGYALAVVDPCCGNVGGGGFMLIRMHDGRERFIDFREKAPLRATRDMYLDANGNVVPNRSRKGWLAIGVPGTVMGFDRALTEFGTMQRPEVMAPAIRLARDGFVLNSGDLIPFAGAPTQGYTGASTFAQPNVRTIWMSDGQMPHAGERIVQTNLANTLQEISDGGTAATRAMQTAAFFRCKISLRTPSASHHRCNASITVSPSFRHRPRVRRCDALPNSQYHFALSARGLGLAQRARSALCGRSRTPRVRRP